MRRPALSLIATSAVLAALAIAVPALAASSSSTPAAHIAARKCSAVIVVSHHRRVRACLVQGPRGFTGFPGPKGATGKTGPAGKNGANGKNGTNGKDGTNGAPATARAYAIVQPTSPSAATLISSSNILTVSEPSAGIYCITPAAGITSSGIASVSPEVSYSAGNVPGVIAVNAQPATNCPSAPFEVDTYAPGTATPVLATGYAFTIVIP